MTYQEIIVNLSNSITKKFDEVYHSAEIVINDKNIKLPAISIHDEWLPLVPSDQKETIYIRRNGDDEVIEELKMGSCSKSYKMRSQLRIVFFRDHAKSQNKILSDLLQSILIQGTKLNRVVRDKWKLLKDESSGDYNFGATTAYFAIDIYALWTLYSDFCEQDCCVDIENPVRKCLTVLES